MLKDGDAWFNSGDLIRRGGRRIHRRAQSTISSSIVSAIRFAGVRKTSRRTKSAKSSTSIRTVQFCNVYGVAIPNADGRAGWRRSRSKSGLKQLDLADFSAFVARELPSYARPVFLRIQPEMEVTGTFKLMKGDLRREGYDLATINDPLYRDEAGPDRVRTARSAVSSRRSARVRPATDASRELAPNSRCAHSVRPCVTLAKWSLSTNRAVGNLRSQVVAHDRRARHSARQVDARPARVRRLPPIR